MLSRIVFYVYVRGIIYVLYPNLPQPPPPFTIFLSFSKSQFGSSINSHNEPEKDDRASAYRGTGKGKESN